MRPIDALLLLSLTGLLPMLLLLRLLSFAPPPWDPLPDISEGAT